MVISLEDLVDDVLIRILTMLTLRDVLSVRQTSTRLESITHLRAIWHDQFHFEVLSKGLPIPGNPMPLSEISALVLERRTRFAARVQRVWTHSTGSLRPVIHRNIPAATQVALRIGGDELLTLHTDRVIAWHFDGAGGLGSVNIMQERLLEETSGTWKMYKDCGSSNAVAIADSSGKDVLIFEGSFNESPLERRYPGRVVGFSNKFMVTSTAFTSDIDIYNWASLSLGSATIHPGLLLRKFVALAEFDSHLLVLWETCLQIFPVPTLPEIGQSIDLNPIKLCLFPFSIRSSITCSPCTPLHFTSGGFILRSNPGHIIALSICCTITGTRKISGLIFSKKTANEGADAPPVLRLGWNPFILGEDCIYMKVGHTGCGLWLDSLGNVYRCNTVTVISPSGDKYSTVEMGRRHLVPLCTLPRVLQDKQGDCILDFDEGMGRIVYCDEAGLLSVVDLV